MLGIDVDGFLQDKVVLFCFSDLFHHLVGALQHLLQFLVLAGVQVFLELTALALKFTILVQQLLLPAALLLLGQGGCLTLEFVGQ